MVKWNTVLRISQTKKHYQYVSAYSHAWCQQVSCPCEGKQAYEMEDQTNEWSTGENWSKFYDTINYFWCTHLHTWGTQARPLVTKPRGQNNGDLLFCFVPCKNNISDLWSKSKFSCVYVWSLEENLDFHHKSLTIHCFCMNMLLGDQYL